MLTKTVPLHALPAIREALAQCHARDIRHATRAGVEAPPAPILTLGEPWVVAECPACGRFDGSPIAFLSSCHRAPVAHMALIEVTLTGTRPTVGAWELLAVVEGQPRDFEGQPSPNMVRMVPGAALSDTECAPWRDADATHCDHCNVRRSRSETFLCREVATGKIVQVGRQCLTAFLGGESYASIVARLAWPQALEPSGGGDEEGCGGRWARPAPETTRVLALTVSVVRRFGWVSKSAATDTALPTASIVQDLCNPPPPGTQAHIAWARLMAEVAPEDGDIDHATAALTWAREEFAPRSDFDWNLRTAARLATVERYGVACYVVPAYDRAMGRATARRALSEAQGPTAHLGAVGDKKVSVTGILEACHASETQFGTTTRIVVRSGTTLAVWWKSGPADATWRVGANVRMVGTIKAHESFKGDAQTIMTRCKLEILP